MTCVDVGCLESPVKHSLNCFVSRHADVSKDLRRRLPVERLCSLYSYQIFFESDRVLITIFIVLMSNRKFWKPIDDRAYSNLKVCSPAVTNHLDLTYMQLQI